MQQSALTQAQAPATQAQAPAQVAPATQAPAAKAKAPVKPRTVKPGKTTQAPAAKRPFENISHYLGGHRPGSGNFLASYTQAWIVVCGLDKGEYIPRHIAEQIAGKTMVKYHINETEAFLENEKGVTLTPAGKIRFFGAPGSTNRQIRFIPEVVEAFKAVFLKGEAPDPKLGTKVTKMNIAVFKPETK